jgi:hypothetical protein
MHTHMLHSSRLFLSPLDMREERKSHEKQIVERKHISLLISYYHVHIYFLFTTNVVKA